MSRVTQDIGEAIKNKNKLSFKPTISFFLWLWSHFKYFLDPLFTSTYQNFNNQFIILLHPGIVLKNLKIKCRRVWTVCCLLYRPLLYRPLLYRPLLYCPLLYLPLLYRPLPYLPLLYHLLLYHPLPSSTVPPSTVPSSTVPSSTVPSLPQTGLSSTTATVPRTAQVTCSLT